MFLGATPVLWLLVRAAETVPDDDDVVAGAWGAATFVGLLLALAVLGYSLNKHLRRAEANQRAGVFEDEVADPDRRDPAQGNPASSDPPVL
jgi:hypothetical protein